MISTFLLMNNNSDINIDASVLDISPSSFIKEGNIFFKLKSALEYAISHDEDLVYCVCGSDFQYNFNFDDLSNVINDIATEGIYALYVNANYEDFISVNNELITISNISSVSSFILLKPIYKYVISLLTEIVDNSKMNLIKFLEIIIPNAFLLLKNEISTVKQHKIHIISPFRNAINYIEDYLSSILNQNFRNYSVTIIDDCSTDATKTKIPLLPFINKIINSERKFALQNIIDVLINGNFDDDDIICLVDADDMLPHKYVLNIINGCYENNSILMTYGSMSCTGSFIKMGAPYYREEFDNIRKSTWKMSHLRTFKYKVFKALLVLDVDLKCFRDSCGNIFKMPYDMALLFPMMELVSYESVLFLDTLTYKYRLHSDNDQLINRNEQYIGEIQIRKKKGFDRYF